MRVWSSSHWSQWETFHWFKWDYNEASYQNQSLEACCYWQWWRRRTQLALRSKDVVVRPWVKTTILLVNLPDLTETSPKNSMDEYQNTLVSAQQRISANHHEHCCFCGQLMGQFSDPVLLCTGGWTKWPPESPSSLNYPVIFSAGESKFYLLKSTV